MRERQIVSEIIKMIKREFKDCFFWKVNDSATAGIPDIVGCYKGHFFGAEVKRPLGYKVSRLQEIVIQRIRDSGGYSRIITSVTEMREFLLMIEERGEDLCKQKRKQQSGL